MDGGTKVLGRVKEILSQPDVNSSDETSSATVDYEATIVSAKPTIKSGDRRNLLSRSTNIHSTSFKPVLITDDEECTILAPSSPEDTSDTETQHFGGPGGEFVVCIPETVPFDFLKPRSGEDHYFQDQNCEPSPSIHQRSARKLTSKKSPSPVKKLSTPRNENKKRLKSASAELLDVSTYSPPILEDFNLPVVLNHAKLNVAQGLNRAGNMETDHLPTITTIKTEKIDAKGKSTKTGQRPLSEQQQHPQTPKSQPRKTTLKQTRLALTKRPNDSSANGEREHNRISTKTVRISPPYAYTLLLLKL